MRSLLVLALVAWAPLRLAEDEARGRLARQLVELAGCLPAIAYAALLVVRSRRPGLAPRRQAPALHLVGEGGEVIEPRLRPTARWP